MGLYIMPNTMKEVMKPVETVVSKNQFSWRAEWPRVLVAPSLVRPWYTGIWWVLLWRKEQPNVSSRCRRNGREVRAEGMSYLAMVWK